MSPKFSTLCSSFALLALGAFLAPVAIGDEAGRASLIAARVGQTSLGIPRVVLQLDRPATFLVVEAAEGNGFELQLPGVVAGSAAQPVLADGHAITNVQYVPSATGLVVRVTLDDTRRVGCSSTLTNPPRIVLDLPKKDGRRDASARVNTTPAAERVKRSAPATKPRALVVAAPATRPAEALAANPAVIVARDLQDLASFAGEIRERVDQISRAEQPEHQATMRRDLARLLAARGLLVEAEHTLLGALESNRPASATEDSLTAAEFRLQQTNSESCLAIAEALEPTRMDDAQRLRLARVLLDAGSERPVARFLEPVVRSTVAENRARAKFLTARGEWLAGRPAEALALVTPIVRQTATPDDVLPGAVLLEADCLFALSRPADARGSYERAARFDLTPEESSWTSLQLGNVARRTGSLEDARRHYETTKERWPDTFYAMQADWFLQFDERLRAAHGAGEERARG